MTLSPETIKHMVRHILGTRPYDIGCDACLEQIDRFVDLQLAAKSAAEAMPLVHDHLQRCADCHEEYEALLAALGAVSSSL